MSKPLSAMHHVADMILVPGEDSSTGNVTGERKLARHDLQAAHLSTSCVPDHCGCSVFRAPGNFRRAWP
jgi:hypothetical protein